MIGIGRLARGTSLFVLGLVAAGLVLSAPARAVDIHFIGGDDTDNSWSTAANWSSDPALPGETDTVIVDNPASNGPAIHDGDAEKVKSLEIDNSLSVENGGSLTVTDGITNNGPGYFVNDGVVTVKTDGGTVGTIANTYTDDSRYGYVGNSRSITANLDNDGSVVNGGDGTENNGVTWTGDVSNGATGFLDNVNHATWLGNVTDNAGSIYSEVQSSWTGNVESNSTVIENSSGSTWTGNVVSNDENALINNISGASWNGDVEANQGSVNNDGGTWNGNVLSNTGVIFNTAASTWNGDMTSSGDLWLSGVVNGSVTNTGGTVHVYPPLSGVTDFVNTDGGALDMDDGTAGGTLSAQNWSGDDQTGNASFDFAPALGTSDHVVLSGDYSADTHIDLYNVGPTGRTLGDIPLILVGGANTGTVEVDGLPDDGVISYRLAETPAGWVLAASLNDAPSHVADAIGIVGDAIASATLMPLHDADSCGRGGWIKGLGASHAGSLAGFNSNLGFGGVELGYDFSCLGIGDTGARIGGGIVLGSLGGTVAVSFPGDEGLNASFGEGFAGAYGRLAAGALHAIVQGQVGLADYRLADPGALVQSATLTSTRFDLNGNASYDLALGGTTLAPELGFAAAQTYSTSDDFADVGKMALLNGPSLDAHAGATLSGAIGLGDGVTTLRPFASVALHDALVSGGAAFSDGVGNSTAIALAQAGNYVALGFGADLLRAPVASGLNLDAGLRADLKYGENVSDTGLSGHVRLQF